MDSMRKYTLKIVLFASAGTLRKRVGNILLDVCFVNQVPLIGKVIWYLSLTAWLIYITRYIEIKNKLIMGEKGEMVFRNMYKGYN